MGAVVIGIPTYRRPDRLAVLLATLAADLAGSRRVRTEGVRVVVADNACDPRTLDVVSAHLPDVPASVVDVEIPGVSAVRNALARDVLADPDARWLVMLDDDGQVITPWLDVLLDAGDRLDADLIAGPVLGELPQNASRLARNSLFSGRLRPATGPVDSLNGAQNLAVRRSALAALDEPWFDPALGRSGGEDYEFFRHARARGLRLAWCDEAPVLEPTPADRLSTPALVRRVYSSNRVGAHVDLAYEGAARPTLTSGRHAWWTVKAVGAGVLRRDPDRFYEAVLKTVGLVGRTVALGEYAARRVPPLARGDHRR